MNDITYKSATNDDLSALIEAGDDLFDNQVKQERALEFLRDQRHHLLLAYKDQKVVGMASGFHYVHPDKDPALFINEVGVMDEFQSQGIGRQLIEHLCELAKSLGCVEAWVATEQSNIAARKAYKAAGGIEEEESIVLYEYKL